MEVISLEIRQMAEESFAIQGNVEDALYLLEDFLNPFDMELAEEYLIKTYGEPEGWA